VVSKWQAYLFFTIKQLKQHPRQRVKSDYRGENTACSGGKQGCLVNAAPLTMNVGIISGLMPWANIRRERHMRFWLEWDRATMGARDLVAKFKMYTQYVTSYEWFKEHRVMPYLLVVVPGKEQKMRIARIVEDMRMKNTGLVILPLLPRD
jgi:hypothetical protein